MTESKMIVKYKKLRRSVKGPSIVHDNSSELGLFVSEKIVVAGQTVKKIKTGICLEIPDGYFGKIWDRNSVAIEHTLSVKAGIIDSSFRGEVTVIMSNTGAYPITLLPGDPIAQVTILKTHDFKLEEDDSLSED